jgi:hypothetical protein
MDATLWGKIKLSQPQLGFAGFYVVDELIAPVREYVVVRPHAIALASNYPRVILLGELSGSQHRVSFVLDELLRKIHTMIFGGVR